jgi:hypothetical protein
VEACGHSPSFGYRGETCELVALGYSWITLVKSMLSNCLGLGANFYKLNHVKPFLL